MLIVYDVFGMLCHLNAWGKTCNGLWYTEDQMFYLLCPPEQDWKLDPGRVFMLFFVFTLVWVWPELSVSQQQCYLRRFTCALTAGIHAFSSMFNQLWAERLGPLWMLMLFPEWCMVLSVIQLVLVWLLGLFLGFQLQSNRMDMNNSGGERLRGAASSSTSSSSCESSTGSNYS